jgi:hypothetical protein
MAKSKHIITVANLPCSAGTFQTHYIARTLSDNAWITGETNPHSRRDPKTFIPEDPLHVIRATRTMEDKEWLAEYQRRISLLIDLYLDHPEASVLIIRDHSLGECWKFQDHPTGSVVPALVQAIEARKVPFTAFYTHRDPFDTFLSIQRSFPGIGKAKDLSTPDRFSSLYYESWQAWKSHCPTLNDIRIEDLADDEAREQARIRKAVFRSGEATATTYEPIKIHREDMASGASGRRNPRPVRMPRHPCTSNVFRSAMNSYSMQSLREAIGYASPIVFDRQTSFSCLHQDMRAFVRKIRRGTS